MTDRAKEMAASLERMRNNPRVESIVLIVDDHACPACQEVQGAYAKDGDVPQLPVEWCSCKDGCTARYQPFLNTIYP